MSRIGYGKKWLKKCVKAGISKVECRRIARRHGSAPGDTRRTDVKIKACVPSDKGVRRAKQLAHGYANTIRNDRSEAGTHAENASYYREDLLKAVARKCGKRFATRLVYRNA